MIVSVLCIALYAGEPENAIGFNSEDRVLILSPHPDDEAIGTAGVIQRALKQNAKIRVVCYTNGDSNQLAFIVYEKRLTFKKAEFLPVFQDPQRRVMRHSEVVEQDLPRPVSNKPLYPTGNFFILFVRNSLPVIV